MIEQLSREELCTFIRQIDSQYSVLEDRIRDIRDKQAEFLTQQIKAKHLIYRIDDEAGLQTCPTCLTPVERIWDVCPQCGEEL